jgi:hypothetical protein
LEKTHSAAKNRTERECRVLIAQGKADRNLMAVESILFGEGNAFQRRRSLSVAENMEKTGESHQQLYGTTKAGRKTQELVEASRQRRLSEVGKLTVDPNSPTSKLFIGDTQAADDFRMFQHATQARNDVLLTAADTTPMKPHRPDVGSTATSIRVSWRKGPNCHAMIEQWDVQWREVQGEEEERSEEGSEGGEAPGEEGKKGESPLRPGASSVIRDWYVGHGTKGGNSTATPDEHDWYSVPRSLLKKFARQCVIDGLPPMCDLIEFRVRAASPGGGWSAFSEPSTMVQTTSPELTNPLAPECATVTANTVLFKWDPPDPRIGVSVTYKLEGKRKESGNGFVVLFMGKGTSFNVGETGASLIPGTEYEFKLYYICPDGRKLASPVTEVRTLDETDHVYANRRGSGEELPLGWSEEVDERTGDTYYYHADSGATQWDPPETLTLPPLAMAFAKKRFAFLFYLWGAPHTNRVVQNLNIKRDRMLPESFRAFSNFSMSELRAKLRIEFQGEPGIDSGGLTKDWFLSVSKQLLQPGLCLFKHFKGGNCYHIDPRSGIAHEDHLKYFEFFGKLLAKAIFERHMIDCRLSQGFLRVLCGKPLRLEDLGELDPQYFIGLNWMLHNEIDGVIYEKFSVFLDNFGVMEEFEIVPKGKYIDVTDENKAKYVQAISKWKLRDSVSAQLAAVLRGFHTLIPPSAAATLRPNELGMLLNGRSDIDLDGLRAKSQYTGGYTSASTTVHYFWQCFKKMSSDEQRLVLKFCTGTSQFPLDSYDPPFTLTLAEGDPLNALPRAHTCFNQLVLPPYESPKILKSKLIYAMENTEGFELT